MKFCIKFVTLTSFLPFQSNTRIYHCVLSQFICLYTPTYIYVEVILCCMVACYINCSKRPSSSKLPPVEKPTEAERAAM